MTTDATDHPLRRRLNDEAHARPSYPLATPSHITTFASLSESGDGAQRETDRLNDLLKRNGHAALDRDTKHCLVDLGDYRLRFERHTEFVRYSFIRMRPDDDGFDRDAATIVPPDWLSQFGQRILMAVHLYIGAWHDADSDAESLSNRHFDGNPIVGAMVAGERAAAFTDFRIHDDGFSRILLLNRAMPAAQTGRYAQRLLEIEMYRMMSLLGLPLAQSLMPQLSAADGDLVEINDALVGTQPVDEYDLLKRLTELAAQNQVRHAQADFRLGAANAYYNLVLQRIAELRETRIPGTQTFNEFTLLRLAPAIRTCHTVAERLDSLARRLARSTQLLSTRVDVERQKQSNESLDAMNRRLRSQLRLQATVETISVAAVTYYVVELVGFIARAAAERGLSVNEALAQGIAVPIVAGLTFWFVRGVRRNISRSP